MDRRVLTLVQFFITLTYPRNWRHDAPSWKLDLEAWARRVAARDPSAYVYWRLEFQERGAPHFHLLLFGLDRVDSAWLHGVWYGIIGSTDRYHWRYGTDVRPIREWKQVARYVSKYTAKVDDSPAPDGVGRYWGIKMRKNRKETVLRVATTEEEFYKVRRVFKQLLGAKSGYHAPGGPRSGVWCRVSNADAKRALDWASNAQNDGGYCGVIPAFAPDDASDSLERGSGWSSRADSVADLRMTTAHNDGRTSAALFDSRDLDRRSARRLT